MIQQYPSILTRTVAASVALSFLGLMLAPTGASISLKDLRIDGADYTESGTTSVGEVSTYGFVGKGTLKGNRHVLVETHFIVESLCHFENSPSENGNERAHNSFTKAKIVTESEMSPAVSDGRLNRQLKITGYYWSADLPVAYDDEEAACPNGQGWTTLSSGLSEVRLVVSVRNPDGSQVFTSDGVPLEHALCLVGCSAE